jgi:hypothetical protein
MPPRRKKPSGLTEEDVARLRSQLGEGRRPRVALSGPQFAGASGTVVRIGDPVVEGADFVTVRVKVNGVTDELAFAPAELSIGRAPRPAAAGAGEPRAGAKPAAKAAAKPTTKAAAKPAVTPAAKAAVSPPAKAAVTPAVPSPTPSAPSAADDGEAPAAAVPPAAAATAGAPDAAASPASRRRKAPATPTVSVTISSTGASWSVSASRGARTILKNAPVAPGAVTAIADLLDQPGLSEAVAEINETARLQAQQRAEQLRAELSDLEAMLATHRAPR